MNDQTGPLGQTSASGSVLVNVRLRKLDGFPRQTQNSIQQWTSWEKAEWRSPVQISHGEEDAVASVPTKELVVDDDVDRRRSCSLVGCEV